MRVTARTLSSRGLDACQRARKIVRHLLPATLHVDPERNLPLAIRIVDAYASSRVSFDVGRDLYWLAVSANPSLRGDACQALVSFNRLVDNYPHVVDVSLAAQLLAMVADRP